MPTADPGPAPVTHWAVTRDTLAAAFAEWHRRLTQEPDGFSLTPYRNAEEYGTACASVLTDLLDGQEARRRGGPMAAYVATPENVAEARRVGEI